MVNVSIFCSLILTPFCGKQTVSLKFRQVTIVSDLMHVDLCAKDACQSLKYTWTGRFNYWPQTVYSINLIPRLTRVRDCYSICSTMLYFAVEVHNLRLSIHWLSVISASRGHTLSPLTVNVSLCGHVAPSCHVPTVCLFQSQIHFTFFRSISYFSDPFHIFRSISHFSDPFHIFRSISQFCTGVPIRVQGVCLHSLVPRPSVRKGLGTRQTFTWCSILPVSIAHTQPARSNL